eukprot:2342078-Rhodomonas_salina.2
MSGEEDGGSRRASAGLEADMGRSDNGLDMDAMEKAAEQWRLTHGLNAYKYDRLERLRQLQEIEEQRRLMTPGTRQRMMTEAATPLSTHPRPTLEFRCSAIEMSGTDFWCAAARSTQTTSTLSRLLLLAAADA